MNNIHKSRELGEALTFRVWQEWLGGPSGGVMVRMESLSGYPHILDTNTINLASHPDRTRN